MEEGKLYYNITEVAEMLGVRASLLRFWEKEFKMIKPTKTRRGDRFYKQADIDLIRHIYYLTRDCGYTLEGAKEQLRIEKNNTSAAEDKKQIIKTLMDLKSFLTELKSQL